MTKYTYSKIGTKAYITDVDGRYIRVCEVAGKWVASTKSKSLGSYITAKGKTREQAVNRLTREYWF